jgi:soluble lytic murein transglycosylase
MPAFRQLKIARSLRMALAPRKAVRILLPLFLVACGHRDTAPPLPVDAGPPPDAAPLDAALEASVGMDPDGPLAWPDAIRVGRWSEAADGLAKLAPGEQAKPEVRLARARVALMTGKAPEAISLLDKLEDELPLLRDLVAKTRALAMFEAGPFDKAAELLAARKEVTSLVLAAEAWDKAQDGNRARAAWERVINAPGHTRVQEEKARLRRMQIARLKDGESAAAVDARWLIANAHDDAAFTEAVEVLEKSTPPIPIKAEDLLARAHLLAEVQRPEQGLRALEKAALKGGVSPLDLCRAKAEVLYKARTRYPEAALVYRSCSALGGVHAAEDAFLSARAFSRADRDVDATAAFKAVMAAYKGSVWADQAEFHIARTFALTRKWKEAAKAFDDYLAHWPAGKEKREALRYQALAYLSAKENKKARGLLESLVGSAEDPITAARWTNLAAVAALNDGDKLHALGRWADVARTQPLSYPALIARARLKENGGALPLVIEPASPGAADPVAIDLPTPADMLHRIGFDAEAEEALKEHEPAVTAKFPTRRTVALCAAYGQLDRAKRRFQLSLGIQSSQIQTAPGPKTRTFWECVFPEPYAGSARTAAAAARIEPELIWSVMRQESAFDPEVVSPAHAVGLMQLLPDTATKTAAANHLAHDDSKLVAPAQSILLGALYLRELLEKLHQNTALSVAAYNAGPEAIQRWLGHAKGETLDVFIEAIPFVETRGYVARVMGNLARYGYLDHGEPGVPAVGLELPSEK